MKKIEDYLHLYLGCETLWEQDSGLVGGIVIIDGHLVESAKHVKTVSYKPILRPLSSMTEEEVKEYVSLGFGGIPVMKKEQKLVYTTFTPPCFVWLLKKGFDLFGLIDAGLAIDSTNPGY